MQYSPHALQFSSSFSPRRHSGVCVAPQLLHSALTPPGAELGVLFCCEEFTGVALGPVERVLTDCVRTLSDGRLPCDDADAPAPAPDADADADASDVGGPSSLPTTGFNVPDHYVQDTTGRWHQVDACGEVCHCCGFAW